MGNLLDILILFGAIQGFISSILLLGKKKQQASRLLGLILLFISLACLNIFLFNTLPLQVPTFVRILERTIPLIIIMPMGPLIFFHVRSLAGIPFSFKTEWRHFISSNLDFIPALAFLISTVLYLVGFLSSFEPLPLQEWNGYYEKYVDIPRWLSTSIYLVFTMRFVSKRRLVQTTWTKQLLIVFVAFQVVWLFHLIPYLVPSTSGWLLSLLGWYPIYIPLTVLVYWLGIAGLIHLRNHRVTAIDESEMQKTIDKLNSYIEKDEAYLDPNISLSTVIENTGLTQKEVSAALNQHLGKSFNEWINSYRVEEVKRKLKDSQFDHFSMTGIALDSGFNSQATFQRAFKSATGMTPKVYRSSHSSDD